MARINVEYEVANGEVRADVRIYPERETSSDMEKFLNTDARKGVAEKLGYEYYWSHSKERYVFQKEYIVPAVSWDSIRNVIRKDTRDILLHLGSTLSANMPLILPPESEEWDVEDPIYKEAEEE